MKNHTIGLLIENFTYFCSNNYGASNVFKTNQHNARKIHKNKLLK